jgi:hypothetical protein
MKTKEAIEILEFSNKWRRGEGDTMPDTKIFGEAIDFAVVKLKGERYLMFKTWICSEFYGMDILGTWSDLSVGFRVYEIRLFLKWYNNEAK